MTSFFQKRKLKMSILFRLWLRKLIKKMKKNFQDENLKNEVDFDNLFINANFEKGKKIVKQCAGCHDLEKSKK